MKFCPRYSSILLCHKPDGQSLLTRSRCKNWRCAYCAKKNSETLRKRIAQAIKQRQEWFWYFVTITSNRRDRTTEGTYHQIKKNWNNYLRQLKRDLGKMEYMMILELHKNKAFHVHAFIGLEKDYQKPRKRAKRSKKNDLALYLSEVSPAYGFGYMCDAQRIKNVGNIGAVSLYVRKSIAYVTKSDATVHAIPKKGRLYQQSRLFSSIKDEAKDSWIARNFLYIEDMRGTEWYDLNMKKVVTYDDFQGDIYPSPNEALDIDSEINDDYIEF